MKGRLTGNGDTFCPRGGSKAMRSGVIDFGGWAVIWKGGQGVGEGSGAGGVDEGEVGDGDGGLDWVV